MLLSVVIPTRNRAELLEKALSSLRHQTLQQNVFEVIVVDNDSTDRTAAVCREAESWFSQFQYSHASKPGLHVGRHRGLKLARGDILVYADDDIRAEPGWLSAIADAFQCADVALVGGKCIPEYEIEPQEWHRELWTMVPEGKYNIHYSLVDFGDEPKDIPAHYVFGCNFSIRKSVLIDARGFHPDGMPKTLLHLRGDGETAVSQRVADSGLRSLYAPGAAVHHFVSRQRLTLDYLYDRGFNEGISASYSLLRRTRKFGVGLALRAGGHTLMHFAATGSVIRRTPSRALHRGFHAGFAWHQRRAYGDTSLQRWITKEHYLDDDETGCARPDTYIRR